MAMKSVQIFQSTVVFLLALIISAFGLVKAQTVSINLYPTEAAVSDPFGGADDYGDVLLTSNTTVGVEPAANWNNVLIGNGGGSFGTLHDNFGNTTSLTVSATGEVANSYDDTPDNSVNVLLNGALSSGYSNMSIEISNVPYATYDLIVYYTSQSAPNKAFLSIQNADGYTGPGFYAARWGIANGSDEVFMAGFSTNAAIPNGSNYARFSNLTDPAVSLAIGGVGGGAYNSLFGLQVVAVPEPSQILILGMAGIAFLARRNRSA